MERKTSILIALVVFALATLGYAAEGKLATVKGQVVAVDLKLNTVTVKAEGPAPKEVSIQLGADTKIVRGDAPITLKELGIGEKVTVNGKEVAGKLTAVTIGVDPKS
jgi:hypothetical protein